MRRPKILVFPGTLNAGSPNARLAGAIVKALIRFDCEITRISPRDYELPLFDADPQDAPALPRQAVQLARLFHEHDAIVIVSPEYNASVSPLLKNAIDWISRVESDAAGPLRPFAGKLFAVSSAAPGAYGGIRNLIHLRDILSSLGALVLPEQLVLSHAGDAFDRDEALKDGGMVQRMEAMCVSMVDRARLLSTRRENE